MTLTQQEYDEMEDQLLVDPETGEVLASDPSEADLPKLARAIRSHQRKIEKYGEFGRQQVEQITRSVERAVERERQTIEILHQKAKLIVSAMDGQKAVMPGIGRFRFRKMPVSVDDTAYQGLPEELQLSVRSAHEDLFKTKTTVTPDKKAIKAFLQTGADVTGFALTSPEDVFEFKED